MGTLEQTECPECGQIVHYQPQRWKAQVICSNCQASFPVEAPQPPAVPPQVQSPIPSHLQENSDPQLPAQPASVSQPATERVRYQRSKIGGLVSTSLLLFALIAAIIGGIWGLAMWDSKTAEEKKNQRAADKDANHKINYALAGKKRAKLGNLEVAVKLVEFGPLRVKDQNNKVHVSSEPLLQIFVEIRSRGSRPVDYVSWYGNSFKRGNDQVVAQLSDTSGKIFNMPVFGDVKGLFGHTPQAKIEKNERIQDCIVFELPAGASVTDFEELRLSLPMECFGNFGTLYFKIPKDLIRLVSEEAGNQ